MPISFGKFLIVQLKLFDEEGNKSDVEVDIPDILKVHRNYYKLVGFIKHFGTSRAGHYTYCYKLNKNWF
jgi:ubiquitin C-terminal hydrolase